MPKLPKPEPDPVPAEHNIDLTNLTWAEIEIAARGWKVPPHARVDVEHGKALLRWERPLTALPEPQIKLASELRVGDKIRHAETGEWLVVFAHTLSPATGLIYWRMLNNRLQPVDVGFLASHEVPVYQEIR